MKRTKGNQRKPVRAGLLQAWGTTIRRIYSPKYIVLNTVIAVIYFVLFQELLKIQNFGIVITSVPYYLVFAITVSASVLLTVTISSFFMNRKERSTPAGALGTATVLFSGIFGGCGCSTPILFALTAVGVSTSGVVSLINTISSYLIPIFTFMIAINLFAIIYYVNRISRTACKMR